jgi:NADPH:quinone reductase
MSTMQAIHVARKATTVDNLELASKPIPELTSPTDILVQLRAVALNPVDTKRRLSREGAILGYDGAGIVVAAGAETSFVPGDHVLYAGDVTRPGSNAQFQLVDGRIAAKKPDELAWEEAAALPLVGLTAWEMFTDHFRLKPGDNSKEILVIVNGAGGVGSMAIQLAKKVSCSNSV